MGLRLRHNWFSGPGGNIIEGGESRGGLVARMSTTCELTNILSGVRVLDTVLHCKLQCISDFNT